MISVRTPMSIFDFCRCLEIFLIILCSVGCWGVSCTVSDVCVCALVCLKGVFGVVTVHLIVRLKRMLYKLLRSARVICGDFFDKKEGMISIAVNEI